LLIKGYKTKRIYFGFKWKITHDNEYIQLTVLDNEGMLRKARGEKQYFVGLV
jgi:hypothetical protein